MENIWDEHRIDSDAKNRLRHHVYVSNMFYYSKKECDVRFWFK